jgi:hypothetical protein
VVRSPEKDAGMALRAIGTWLRYAIAIVAREGSVDTAVRALTRAFMACATSTVKGYRVVGAMAMTRFGTIAKSAGTTPPQDSRPTA